MKKSNFTSTILIILMGVAAMGLFLGRGQDVESSGSRLPIASINSSSPSGLKGFYLILKKWHPNIHRWKRPLYAFTEDKQGEGVLVIADPLKPLSPLEKESLDNWLKRGGMVIVMRIDDWLIQKTGYHEVDNRKSFRQSYGIKAVGSDPITVSPFEGKGQLVVVPYVYNNKTLQSDPQKIVEIVQQIVMHGGPVYFDEYHLNLGENDGFLKILRGFLMTKWGVASLHLFFVFLIVLLVSRRSQLSEEQSKDSEQELSSNHFILSRGLLLKSAEAKEFCRKVIKQYNRRFFDDKGNISKTTRRD